MVQNIQGEMTYGKIGEWRFDKRSYDLVVKHSNSDETAVTCNTSKTELVRSSSL